MGAAGYQNVDVGTVSTQYTLVGAGDFTGDGVLDILWQDVQAGSATAGQLYVWRTNPAGQWTSAALSTSTSVA